MEASTMIRSLKLFGYDILVERFESFPLVKRPEVWDALNGGHTLGWGHTRITVAPASG